MYSVAKCFFSKKTLPENHKGVSNNTRMNSPHRTIFYNYYRCNWMRDNTKKNNILMLTEGNASKRLLVKYRDASNSNLTQLQRKQAT